MKLNAVQIMPMNKYMKPIGIKKNGSCNGPSVATRDPIKLKVKKLNAPKR